MSAPLMIALALLLAADPAPAADADLPPLPAGAPADDYSLVSWCYGALRGYLELHDTVMPEVTRIETTYRKPGSKLSEDLKVYADMQRDGRASLKVFARAIETAERASVRPINAVGAAAVAKGRSTWAAAPTMPKARVAQEWMSWALPARCVVAADRLEKRAALMGPAFQVNAPADAAPAETAAPEAADATPAEAAPAETAAAPAEAAPPESSEVQAQP